jgi:predicted signal transduction protein with EAL and GGDEF domain
MGCDVAQGWYYARPMPADELALWLSRYRPPQRLLAGWPGQQATPAGGTGRAGK